MTKKRPLFSISMMIPLLGILFCLTCPNQNLFGQYLTDWKKTIFLEAEGFAHKGGWTVDQQYMNQMGSPVLLAHGFGTPVADAKTTVVFPVKGTYRVYARTRNWVSPWTTDYAPGQFQVALDGKRIETIFGTEGNPWHWQQGKSIIIENDQQSVEVSLCDLTGFDGRIDALCFTADDGFVPPENLEAMKPLRDQSQGISADIVLASDKPYDLVVVGGGIAGTCSAISAARHGIRVALIQDRPVLGGNNSNEIRVHLCGDINKDPYPNLGNLTYQMGPHAGGNGREGAHYKVDERLELVKAEKTLDLFLSTHVIKAETTKVGENMLITAVIGQNIETGKLLRFEGKTFADCTGDANLGFMVGADWRMGREGRDETGESLAPEQGDKMTMGSSIQWNTVEDKENNAFPVLPWAIQFTPESIRPLTHGDWNWEAGMNLDQIKDFEQIRDLGLRAAYGHWAYMKNQMTGTWAEKVKNLKLGWVSCFAGKRESRRLLGDVILAEQDLTSRREWDDASVTTTWSIDLHYPDDDNKKYFPGEEFRSVAKFFHIPPYPIPYRCLYSRNINNLFMAGRNISVTHVALGTIRVMRTGGMMGEVVGMAAGICTKHDCLPRDVYTSHLAELQQSMEKGIAPPTPASKLMVRPDWLKEAKNNLALKAKVEVSGLYEKTNYPAKYINDGKYNIHSNVERWVSDTKSDAANIHWAALCFDEPQTINAFQLISGVAGGKEPIRDFVFQYEKDGQFIDVPETLVMDNQSSSIAMKFPEVTSKKFRIYVTNTPGNLARIWELELYRVPNSK